MFDKGSCKTPSCLTARCQTALDPVEQISSTYTGCHRCQNAVCRAVYTLMSAVVNEAMYCLSSQTP